MDYRKFLGRVETWVLPYFGGAHVDLPTRRLRVSTPPPSPGWWRFEIQGRTATARAPAEPEGLEGLPLVRGHFWSDRLVHTRAQAEPVRLLPEDAPPRFSPVRARRWHDGTLVYEALDFEDEAEGIARERWEARGTLADVRAVSASLRAAFGYARVETVARTLGIRFVPAEVRGQVLAVAETGDAAAEARLRALARERSRGGASPWTVSAPLDRPTEARPEPRVRHALESAGARLLDLRARGSGVWEVTFGFMGERFQSLVEGDTLGVVDAGICLAGEDRRVTLDSLPSVIREAIEEDVLVITRHA
ncbi:hypothetical protein [Melittangium boletus]|uniref:hypothetical protein n=1 Tax=Melittangium boletus TaxID=83453 RepID=UPI003DA6B5F5